MLFSFTLPSGVASFFQTLSRWLEPDLRKQAAAVYSQLVTQARHPWFYAKVQVPDTLDGRFEMLVMHLFLLLRHLREKSQSEAEYQPLAQAVMELMIDDMDQSLREMGVGDMGVSRRIKQMGEAIYGRFDAYEDALAAGPEAVTEALKRNIYGTLKEEGIPSNDSLRLLQAYLGQLQMHFARQSLESLYLGSLRLVAPTELLAVT